MPFDNNYTSTEVWLSFDEPVKGKRFMCGYIPHSQVVDYVNKAGHFVPPKGHCMPHHVYFDMHIHPFKIHDKMRVRQCLYIVVKNSRYMNCPCGAMCPKKNLTHIDECLDQCIANIQNGKCKDAFVIENIGKLFYAHKYKDNNNQM